MGNCQATEDATILVEHPSGKVQKMQWPIKALEVMKMNPGHSVALLLSTTCYPLTYNIQNPSSKEPKRGSVRLTKIKLLKPTDPLLLGHVYRLITTKDVVKGLKDKKQAKVNKLPVEEKRTLMDDSMGNNTNRRTMGRARTWQPALHSILESGS